MLALKLGTEGGACGRDWELCEKALACVLFDGELSPGALNEGIVFKL